jgi:hypothetical protein
MKNHTNTRRRSATAITIALLAGGAIGVTTLGSSQADAPKAATAAAPQAAPSGGPVNQSPPSGVPEKKVWAPEVTAFESAGSAADAEARVAIERTRLADVELDATTARTVEDPTGQTKTWTIVPTASATCAILDDRNVLCGHGDRLAVAGASVIWSTPSPVEQQEGAGSYAFRGLAVDDVRDVTVIDQSGTALARTTPKGSVFAVTVAAAKRPTALRLTGADGQTSVIQVN